MTPDGVLDVNEIMITFGLPYYESLGIQPAPCCCTCVSQPLNIVPFSALDPSQVTQEEPSLAPELQLRRHHAFPGTLPESGHLT